VHGVFFIPANAGRAAMNMDASINALLALIFGIDLGRLA
jgi:hypothetical protein